MSRTPGSLQPCSPRWRLLIAVARGARELRLLDQRQPELEHRAREAQRRRAEQELRRRAQSPSRRRHRLEVHLLDAGRLHERIGRQGQPGRERRRIRSSSRTRPGSVHPSGDRRDPLGDLLATRRQRDRAGRTSTGRQPRSQLHLGDDQQLRAGCRLQLPLLPERRRDPDRARLASTAARSRLTSRPSRRPSAASRPTTTTCTGPPTAATRWARCRSVGGAADPRLHRRRDHGRRAERRRRQLAVRLLGQLRHRRDRPRQPQRRPRLKPGLIPDAGVDGAAGSPLSSPPRPPTRSPSTRSPTTEEEGHRDDQRQGARARSQVTLNQTSTPPDADAIGGGRQAGGPDDLPRAVVLQAGRQADREDREEAQEAGR